MAIGAGIGTLFYLIFFGGFLIFTIYILALFIKFMKLGIEAFQLYISKNSHKSFEDQ